MLSHKSSKATAVIFKALFLAATTLKAQVPDDCSCLKNFDFLVSKAKINYVDYNFRINPQNRTRFELRTDSLRIQAQKASGAQCLSLLEGWVKNFQDPHFTIYLNTRSPRDVSEMLAPVKQSSLPINKIHEYLNDPKHKIDAIEGLWRYTDPAYLQTYQLAIIKDKKAGHDFVGIITQSRSGLWSEGQIRLTIQKTNGVYKTNYFDEHHNLVKTVSNPTKDGIQIRRVGKLYKAKTNPTAEQAKNGSTTDYFEINAIDSKTTYLRISDLFYQHNETISQFLEENKVRLSNTEKLIVDMRDNPGGMYGPLNKLLPLLYTRPILDPGGMILASEENIDAYSRSIMRMGGEWKDKLYVSPLALLDTLKAHKNEMVVQSSDDTVRMERVLSNPKKVAFLVNENTMSAAEMFLMRAHQSDKVTILGQSTRGGTLSGEGNMMPMPCSLLKLYYPMSRNTSVTSIVSKEGKIIPQVIIPDQTEDWIKFVTQYWQQHH